MKNDKLDLCIAMTLFYMNVRNNFLVFEEHKEYVSFVWHELKMLLKKSTSLSNFLKQMHLHQVYFKYLKKIKELDVKAETTDFYFFTDPNVEEYYSFIMSLLIQQWEQKKKKKSKDQKYFDEYLKIIEKGIDEYVGHHPPYLMDLPKGN